MSDPGETTKQREGVSRIRAEAPEGPLSRARFHGLQEGMAGTGLRHHHRRGTQDPRERPPGGPQAPHVVRPGVTRTGGDQ